MSRLNVSKHSPDAYAGFHAVDRALRAGALPATLRELVFLRVSQINRCAFCVDLHSRDALREGETVDRLLQLPGWHESDAYTDGERAALAYAEQATDLDPDGVSDATWAEAERHLTPEQLADLVMAVALANAYNRIAVPMRTKPGAVRVER